MSLVSCILVCSCWGMVGKGMIIRFCIAIWLGFSAIAPPLFALTFSCFSPGFLRFSSLSFLLYLCPVSFHSLLYRCFFLHLFPRVLSLAAFLIFCCTCLGLSHPHPCLQPHPPYSVVCQVCICSMSIILFSCRDFKLTIYKQILCFKLASSFL